MCVCVPQNAKRQSNRRESNNKPKIEYSIFANLALVETTVTNLSLNLWPKKRVSQPNIQSFTFTYEQRRTFSHTFENTHTREHRARERERSFDVVGHTIDE